MSMKSKLWISFSAAMTACLCALENGAAFAASDGAGDALNAKTAARLIFLFIASTVLAAVFAYRRKAGSRKPPGKGSDDSSDGKE